MTRKHARVDRNQSEVVKALRQVGAAVISLADWGHGIPDCLVAFGGKLHLMEIKDGSKPASACRLTADEETFHAWLLSQADVRVHVVHDADQAIAALWGK